MGYCANELRLPLTELSDTNRKVVERAMKESGVL